MDYATQPAVSAGTHPLARIAKRLRRGLTGLAIAVGLIVAAGGHEYLMELIRGGYLDTVRRRRCPMSKAHPSYAPEYRRQMVELVRAGRTPGELAREFQCSSQSIRNWVRQADRDEGLRRDDLTTLEREELRRLRREIRQPFAALEVESGPGSTGSVVVEAHGVRVRLDGDVHLGRIAGVAAALKALR